jgi:hypothetical protein
MRGMGQGRAGVGRQDAELLHKAVSGKEKMGNVDSAEVEHCTIILAKRHVRPSAQRIL